MRTLFALILTATALASPAAAQGNMDRYGYGPAPQSAYRSVPPQQDRRFLDWANKSEASAPSYVEARKQQQTSNYQAFQPQEPYRQPEPQRYAALVEPPPRALPPPAYAPPRPRSPASETQTRLELAGGPPERAPAPMARTTPVRPIAQASVGPSGQARYYSLHREYGLTPDAIPEQQLGSNYVLIGPSSDTKAADDEKADKPF